MRVNNLVERKQRKILKRRLIADKRKKDNNIIQIINENTEYMDPHTTLDATRKPTKSIQ